MSSPATPAASSVTKPRVRPYMQPPPAPVLPYVPETEPGSEIEAPGVEMRGIQLLRELHHGALGVRREHVVDDADLRVVVERHVDVERRDEVHRDAGADGAADGDPDGSAVLGRREQEERRGKDRPRALLRVAVEGPWPLPRSDPPRGEVGELPFDSLEPRRHQVEEDALGEPERRPVELVVRDEARMLLAAAAVEVDLEDGRVRCSRKLLDPPEGRQGDAGLPTLRARERVPRRQRVVHGSVVIGAPDEN